MYSYEYIRPSEEYGEMKTLRSKDAVNGISICVSQESTLAPSMNLTCSTSVQKKQNETLKTRVYE